MKEQLITFETAKLAKEKGFDLPTGIKYTKLWYNDGVLCNWNTRLVDHIIAPTQSLLQKWLREEHNIQLCLVPTYGGSKIEGKQTGWLCYTPFEDEEFNDKPSISLSQYTYEEALEKGLQVALKLVDK